MPDFHGIDFYAVDDLLSDEERMVRDTVRQFVDRKVLPSIAACARDERFPAELVPELSAMGLLGASIQGYGCAGLGPVAYGLAMQELERGDSSLRSFVSVQTSLAMYAIHSFGTEEQKQRWLPPMASGEKIGCFGLTEPDFGSNPAGLQMRATWSGDGWTLDGNKMWITNGSIADVAVVWARSEDGRIAGFLVERGTPGFATTPQKGKWSLRASVTSELHFQGCRIPAASALPGAKGLGAALSCLNQARYGIAWGALGAAMACFVEARDYALSRVQFGKPIASFQLVQAKLAGMLSELTKGQLLALRLGRLKEAGKARPAHVSLAKRDNVHMALEAARTARDILAANGITDEYQCGRHMANLETVKTYEGTHDIHTLILGEEITGIPAYS
jgi:glutaryl-CoA dehydrogenase